MLVKSIAVIFDDRDPKNRGWYYRCFDHLRAEEATDEAEGTLDRPRRADAFRDALRATRRDLRAARHRIAPDCETRVYTSINDDLPAYTL